MNKGFCTDCGALVPCRPETRDGRVFLVKECPAGHRTETLISSDAERYQAKRSLDVGVPEKGCSLHCLECRHQNVPSFVFVDITNRCNLNCPICINNTPSMGFTFDPPMEYFERIFEHFSLQNPPPTIQLFGGEPTVRNDLLDIIALARSKGLPTIQIVTNGLRLADPDYCRKLLDTRTTILLSYDGSNPRTYKILRDSETALDLKRRALDNVRRYGKAKVVLMTCVARGFNDREMADLLEFCHERRDFIRGIYFIPLTESWTRERLELAMERITTEDIERMLQAARPGDRIDFIPAGVFGQIRCILKYLRLKPPPFTGAHPNCESRYLLVSNGTEYVPVSRYLKRTLPDLVLDLIRAEDELARIARAAGREPGGTWPETPDAIDRRLSRKALRLFVGTLRRNLLPARPGEVGGQKSAWRLLSTAIGLLAGRPSRSVFARHANIREILQIIVLPFEDQAALETERMERCPSAFAFWDPRDGKVHSVPVCAWVLHKTKVMRFVAGHFARHPDRKEGVPSAYASRYRDTPSSKVVPTPTERSSTPAVGPTALRFRR